MPNETNKEQNQDTNIAVMANDIRYIKDSLKKMTEKLELMDGHYVRKEEDDKIKAIHGKSIRDLEIAFATLGTTVKTWGIIGGIVFGFIEPIVIAVILSRFL